MLSPGSRLMSHASLSKADSRRGAAALAGRSRWLERPVRLGRRSPLLVITGGWGPTGNFSGPPARRQDHRGRRGHGEAPARRAREPRWWPGRLELTGTGRAGRGGGDRETGGGRGAAVEG